MVVCALATVTLGVRYAGKSGPGVIDRAVDPHLISTLGVHQRLAHDLENLGSPLAVTVLTALLVAALLYLRRPRDAALAALATPVASVLTEWVLKPIFERSRGGSLSYPSGHATGIFTVAAVVVLLVLARGTRLRIRTRLAATIGSVAVAALVAAASVSVEDHYATDTFGGAGTAIATVLGLALIIDAVADC